LFTYYRTREQLQKNQVFLKSNELQPLQKNQVFLKSLPPKNTTDNTRAEGNFKQHRLWPVDVGPLQLDGLSKHQQRLASSSGNPRAAYSCQLHPFGDMPSKQ
jgi:hypothetical protein